MIVLMSSNIGIYVQVVLVFVYTHMVYEDCTNRYGLTQCAGACTCSRTHARASLMVIMSSNTLVVANRHICSGCFSVRIYIYILEPI
jgi:hypothetical protein